jgi:hypothetical protein
MIDRLKRLLGMAWATPPVRTAVQTAAGIVAAAVAADVLNLFDGSVWRGALSAALAAAASRFQAAARSDG